MSYFFIGDQLQNLLFQGLNINDKNGLAAACVIIFFLTVIFEGLKALKIYIDLHLRRSPLKYSEQDSRHPVDAADNSHDGIVLLSSQHIPLTAKQIKHKKILLHSLSTLSHTVNFFYGYLIMLVVMSFSVWLFLAVILGCSVGYWIFGAIGQQAQYGEFLLSQMTAVNSGSGRHQSVSHNLQARGDL